MQDLYMNLYLLPPEPNSGTAPNLSRQAKTSPPFSPPKTCIHAHLYRYTHSKALLNLPRNLPTKDIAACNNPILHPLPLGKNTNTR